MFREQVGTVSTWFDRWTPCEQTVAMVALLRRLHPTQARFLTCILNRQLSDCGELRRAEILANDPNFVASLGTSECKEGVIRDLLSYLPLLNPKNAEVRSLYLAVIPKVLKYTFDHSALMEEARQLLSYSLIHPAFAGEDRELFSSWLRNFEDKVNGTPTNGGNEGLNQYPSSLRDSPPSMQDFGNSWQPTNAPSNNNASTISTPGSQSGLCITNFGGTNYQRIRRSNSLTPPVLHSDAWYSQMQDDLCSSVNKPRSLSLSSEVSPQSSLASSGSGSESHLDDPRPTFISPGMKEVPTWLKSLRLHKYAFLFAHLTFEEMLSLSEDRLDGQGVTKGARHKIVLSIAKLKERPSHLKQIYEEMTGDKESVRNSLTEVKWMLTTPIKPMHYTENEEGNGSNILGGSGSNNNEGGNNSNNSNMGVGPIGSNRYREDNSGEKAGDWQRESVNNMRNLKDVDQDLPAIIVRVIGKACELNPDIECEGLLVSVLDKCLGHDAFTMKQKRLLSLWRQQQAPIARRNSSGHHSHHSHFHGHHRSNNSPSGNSGGSKHRHFSPRVLSLGNQLGSAGLDPMQQSWTSTGNSIHAMFMAKRPSLQDSILESTRSHLSVQRTKSAPLPNFFTSLSSSPPINNFDSMASQPPAGVFGGLDFQSAASALSGSGAGNNVNQSGGSAMDITSRLESLCLSMTEAALGPAFNNY